MPKVVQVPGVGNVEFPDSMSDEDVSAQIRKSAAPAEAAKPASWLDEVKEGASHFLDQVNPVAAVKGLNEAASHPVEAIKSYGAQNDAIRQKAEDAFKAGNYAEGARHVLGYVLNGLPGVGATLDKAGDETGSGKVGAGVGDTLGLAANLAGPAIAGKVIPKIASKISGAAGDAAEGLYKTALKPRIDTPAADVREMAQTGLKNDLPVSEAGAAKLAKLSQDLTAAMQPQLKAAGARGVKVDPNAVANRLVDTEKQFVAQVNPESDLRAIDKSGDEFLRTQGATKGSPAGAPQPTGVLNASGQPIMTPGTPAVPAARAQPMAPGDAQAVKVGTYRKINTDYGEMGTAQIEAQKALARGIKEELGAQIPELNGLNEAQGKLLDLQPVLERAVNKATNSVGGVKGPVTGAVLGHVAGGLPGSAAGAGLGIMGKVLADPAVRSRLAITIYKAQQLNPGKYGAPSMAAATARVAGYGAALQKATLPSTADLAAHYAKTNPGSIATPEEMQAAAEMAIEGHNATR